jgi:carbamate kinase
MYLPGTRTLVGAEVVIDKDRASALLATQLEADLLVMATDVDAVYVDWGTPAARPLRRVTPAELGAHDFAAGSMGPKVEAASAFVGRTGKRAAIGALADLEGMVEGTKGTQVERADQGR